MSARLTDLQRDLTAPVAHRLGWQFSDDDGHVEQQFKAMMFGSAGIAGDEAIVAAATDMFARFVAGDFAAVHPNIRGSVFSISLKYGGVEEVSFASSFLSFSPSPSF